MVQIYTFQKHYASKNRNFLYFLSHIDKINMKKTKSANPQKNIKKGDLPGHLFLFHLKNGYSSIPSNSTSKIRLENGLMVPRSCDP